MSIDNETIRISLNLNSFKSGSKVPKAEDNLGDEEQDLLFFFLKHRKETQAQFCKRHGINNSMFSLWKNGKIKPGFSIHQVTRIINSLRSFKESIENGTYDQILQEFKIEVKEEIEEFNFIHPKESTKEHKIKKHRPKRAKYQNSLFEEYDCSTDWHAHKKQEDNNKDNTQEASSGCSSEDELSLIESSSSSSSEEQSDSAQQPSNNFVEAPKLDSQLYNKQFAKKSSKTPTLKNTYSWLQQKPPANSPSSNSDTPTKRSWSETTQDASTHSTSLETEHKKLKGVADSEEIEPSISVHPFLVKPASLPWNKQCIFCGKPRMESLCCDSLRCYSKIGSSLFPHGLGVTQRNGLCVFAFKEFIAGQTVVPGYWGCILTEEELSNVPLEERTFIHKIGNKLYIDGKPKSRMEMKEMIESGHIGSLLRASTDDLESNAVLIRSNNRAPVIKATRFIAVGDEIVLQSEVVDIPHKLSNGGSQNLDTITSESDIQQQEKRQELTKEIQGMVEVLQSIQKNLELPFPDFENIARMLRPATRTTEKTFQIAKKLSGVEV